MSVVVLRGAEAYQPPERRFDQALAGAIDGVNDTFSAPAAFVASGSRREAVWYNGVRLAQGASADYVVSESVPGLGFDTVRTLFTPRPGDTLRLDFDPA